MLMVCSIVLSINIGGITMLSKYDVEGKYLAQSNYNYLVDFTEGVKQFKVEDAQAYKKVLVNKFDCVKE